MSWFIGEVWRAYRLTALHLYSYVFPLKSFYYTFHSLSSSIPFYSTFAILTLWYIPFNGEDSQVL